MINNKLILLFVVALCLPIPSCEPDKKMAVDTGEASNISTTTADVSGTVIDVGEGATQHGHCYCTTAGPLITGTKTSLGVAVTGDFASNLTGLEPSTKYYARAYCSLGGEAAYGSEITFTTASAALAEMTTTAITGITKNSAVSGGEVTSEGGTPVTERGVCWSTTTGPTTSNSKTSDGSGSGSYTSNISGLNAITIYYVRAYATNAGGTAYGNEISFSTSPEFIVAPAVTTAAVTSVTSNSAVSGGAITSEGGASVTAKGVCWSTSVNPTIVNSKTNDGTGSESFVSSITNLFPGTTYYIRAYATNSVGTSYGEELSFTTGAIVPVVTTIPPTSITRTSASSGGDVTNNGGSTVIARGVCWSTSQNPTINVEHTGDGPGTGTYSSSLTGLKGNTTYYLRAYATNSAGTGYGNEIDFKTAPTTPTITTTEVTSITETTASSGGNIVSEGGASVTARGVCWSTTANPTTADPKTSDGTGSGAFTSSITGLTSGTTYYVRAYATNSAGTDYGTDITFTAGATLPAITTTAISGLTSTTASSGGNITSDGGSSVTARGVCWSTSLNPTVADSKTSDGSGIGSFGSSITGLTPCITYHVRAYATSSAGTAYGNDISFTTSTILPTVNTTEISAITSTTASSGGNISGECSTGVTARGACWSTSANPTIADSKTIDGTGSGSFSSSITGLTPGTLYHLRAYAVNSAGTAYGADIAFTAGAILPAVTTTAISDLTSNTAASGGNVTSDGGSSVTARGVCWSTLSNPTTADSKTNDGAGTGSFASSITGLTPCTTYHVRAYATTSAGTAYGSDISFTAGAVLPTVTTTGISSITLTSAFSGGSISGDCAVIVTERGMCWSTTANPTITDSKTSDGTGGGSFTSSITGLSSNTTYYARAYATNSAGTAYGDEYIIKTATGTVTDYDGNSYYTVTIGTQVWMMENLKTIKYNDGTSIPLVTGNTEWSNLTSSGYCWYSNDEVANKNTYGALYNWYVVNNGNLCPSGWHLPTDAEWTTLAEYLGGKSVAGGKLKETGTSHWWNPNVGATNETGFSATGGGYRFSDGEFVWMSFIGTWWSASEYDASSAWGWFIHCNYELIDNAAYSKIDGFSVRCIEGEPVAIPVLTTTAVTSITATTASCGGNITSEGGASVTARGVCWSTNQNPTIADGHTDDGPGTGIFASSLTGLSSNTTYYVRAYATNSGGTAYGEQVSLTTDPLTVTDIESNVYNVIRIGTQLWTKENLKTTRYNDNSSIPYVTDQTTWGGLTTNAYCWYNNDASTYNDIYGVLYNWYSVNTGKLCPTGWHVPTDAEWTVLTDYLGGTAVAGNKLKEAGTIHWLSINGGTNESGFTALPGGVRNYAGSFYGINENGRWWSFTESSSTFSIYRGMDNDLSKVWNSTYNKMCGLSVRCLKN